jgi:hypothetical protein
MMVPGWVVQAPVRKQSEAAAIRQGFAKRARRAYSISPPVSARFHNTVRRYLKALDALEHRVNCKNF